MADTYEKLVVTEIPLALTGWRAFRLAEPGTRINSCLVVETPEGIGINGDLCPNENRGVWSNLGYGIDWLIRAGGSDYSASKFMFSAWQKEIAEAESRDQLRRATEEGDTEEQAKLEGLCEAAPWSDGEYAFCEAWIAAGLPHDDGCPGYGYASRDKEILQAIADKLKEHFVAKAFAEVSGG